MNRNYRDYFRRMGDAIVLRHSIPRSILSDDELIHIRQAAQSTDLDVLRQTAVEMFPERFQSDDSQEKQCQEQDQQCETSGITMICSY